MKVRIQKTAKRYHVALLGFGGENAEDGEVTPHRGLRGENAREDG